MALVDSPHASVRLREKPERFLTLLGVTVDQFDAIYSKLRNMKFFSGNVPIPSGVESVLKR